MIRALDVFLDAVDTLNQTGLSAADLQAASRKHTGIWIDRFLSGYRLSAQDILQKKRLSGQLDSPQYLTGLHFHGLCPHDLLPFQGTASIAYIPSDGTIGFGQVADLVACYTARLTLQETAVKNIVDALTEYLSPKGSACVLQASHQCLAISRPEQAAHTIRSVATSGLFADDSRLLEALYC